MAAYLQGHGHHKSLVSVGRYGDCGLKDFALAVRHVRHDQGDGGGPPFQFGWLRVQPRLIAGGMGIDRTFFLSLYLEGEARGIPRLPVQSDG